jgi:hypothetical protein
MAEFEAEMQARPPVDRSEVVPLPSAEELVEWVG